MEEEYKLIVPKGELKISELEKNLGELIKPLIKDIFLCYTYVSRGDYDKEMLDGLCLERGDELKLIRQKTKFSEQDILVFAKNDIKLGHILEKDLQILANLMDAGKILYARYESVRYYDLRIGEKLSRLPQVKLKIFMKDI